MARFSIDEYGTSSPPFSFNSLSYLKGFFTEVDWKLNKKGNLVLSGSDGRVATQLILKGNNLAISDEGDVFSGRITGFSAEDSSVGYGYRVSGINVSFDTFVSVVRSESMKDDFNLLVRLFAGNDDVDAAYQIGGLVQLFGYGGNDTLQGSDYGDDILRGGRGNDVLKDGQGGGDDHLFGQDGNDTIYAGRGDDTIDGGKGSDRLYIYGQEWWPDDEEPDFHIDLAITTAQDTGHGLDVIRNIEDLRTLSGNDTLLGNAADNEFRSDEGNDYLNGRGGDDELEGGAGDDLLYGGAGDDDLYGSYGHFPTDGSTIFNDGKDTLFGGVGNDDLYGGSGNDKLYGGSGGDDLYGGYGNDKLFSGESSAGLDYENWDSLLGGAGRDLMFGGTGVDIMRGGKGLDRLWLVEDDARDQVAYHDYTESLAGKGRRDRVFDFESGKDLFLFYDFDADTTTAGIQRLTFEGDVATANALWIVDKGADVFIMADVTGDAVADFVVEVVGVGSLVADDFDFF